MIKSKLLLLFGLMIIVIYTILMLANISGINLKNFWFSLALVFIGFYVFCSQLSTKYLCHIRTPSNRQPPEQILLPSPALEC